MKPSFKTYLYTTILVCICSCNSLKRVDKQEHLLEKATIKVNDKVNQTEVLNNLIYQKPNRKLALIPLRLHIYNLARPNLDSILNERIYNDPKRLKQKTALYSRKQVDKSVLSKLNFNKWLKKTGEAPVIVDDSLTKKTLERLESYYWNNGWFNVTTSSETKRDSQQLAKVTYKVTTNKPFIIDTLSTNIKSPVIDSLYKLDKSNSFLKKGEQYRSNNTQYEKKRITNYMRNHGVFHFSQDYFYFEMDTINTSSKINIEVQIADRNIRVNDSLKTKPFNIYKIKDVNIFTNNSFENRNESYTDTTVYDGYNIYSKGKLRYKPKALTNPIFIKPNAIFRDQDRPLTSRQISNLKTFQYPRIEYIENPDTTLTTNIYLNPFKRFSLGFSAEATQSNIQTLGLALNPSITMRNVFRGAETLELSGFGSIGASKDAGNNEDRFFDINEIGVNLRLNIPRFLFPFAAEKIIPKEMFPLTKISLSGSSQTNIGLDKQTVNGTFNYTWNPNKTVTNRVDLFNIQYIKNLNTSNYFNVYSNSFNVLNQLARNYNYIPSDGELEKPQEADQFLNSVITGNTPVSTNDFSTINNINERKERLTEDNLIIASNFNYIKDKRESLFDNNFSIFKLKVEAAGNLLTPIAKSANFSKNKNGNYKLFGVAFSQYIKTELDYIKYWDLGAKNVFAIRSFIGIAVPLGNSSNIPFSKSFFAGGSNDNRAWSAYSLGPGSLTTNNEFNEANLKIALSAEQRFNILGPVSGALFIDVGNIWNVLDDVDQDEAKFRNFGDLKNIAIGSGFGLRYDFNFFVLRLDTGFKTYDPSYQDKNRWFNDYNFSNAVYNIGINYPF